MKKQLLKAGVIKGSPKNGHYDVPVYRVVYVDSIKNLIYLKKGQELAARATKELGVTCFG